jgi:hypothetical protein
MQFTKCIENEELSPFFLEPLLAARLSEVNALLEQKENELQKAPAFLPKTLQNSGSLFLTHESHFQKTHQSSIHPAANASALNLKS